MVANLAEAGLYSGRLRQNGGLGEPRGMGLRGFCFDLGDIRKASCYWQVRNLLYPNFQMP